MRVPYPPGFASLKNFELAWYRIVRGSNKEYKRFFSHLYPSYQFALQTNLADLISEVREGKWQPSAGVKIYFPKPSGVLRPLTLVPLNDQIVYQSICNFMADKFFRSLRPLYGVKAFGALYAGSSSKFFYRSWKRWYRAFNRAITKAHRAGNHVVADFDLVSFFDLIDHKTLRGVLSTRIRNGHLLDLLFRCLEQWTKEGSGRHLKGHGIPQGPECSAFVAEILLADFDRQSYPGVTYVRYIDDIKLLGTTFSVVDRSLLRLDLHCKRLGLVPQAQKIERRNVTDIRSVLKTVPSALDSQQTGRPLKRLTTATKRRLRKILRQSL
jgi:hypothetical protein